MRFTLQGFDENGNDILDGQETLNFNEEVFYDGPYPELRPWPEADTAVKRNWADSEMDGDMTTCTKAEFVQFYLRNWGSALKLWILIWGSSLLMPEDKCCHKILA